MTDAPGRIEKKNYWLNATEGAFWASGAAMLSPQTVLPALILRLGGGNFEVGALTIISYVGVFLPQVLASHAVEQLPMKKPWVVWFGLAQRICVALIGLSILLLARGRPAAVLWIFLSLLAMSALLTGITTPAWFDLFAKLTRVNRRGRLTGTRNAMAGTLAFLCGFLLVWVLDSLRYPVNYGVIFLFAFLLQSVSILLQSRLIEEEPSPIPAPHSVVDYLARLPEVISHHPGFRSFLVASVFLVLATMPTGFFALYALKNLHAGESEVGGFTLLMVMGQVAGALTNGALADRYGNRLALMIAAGGLLLAGAWALAAPTLAWFRPVFFFLGVNLGSELMTRYNLAIEYGPPELRSTLIGLMNTILAPFYLTGLLGGWLSNLFGYRIVFVVGGIFSMTGLTLLATLVRDPRRKSDMPASL